MPPGEPNRRRSNEAALILDRLPPGRLRNELEAEVALTQLAGNPQPLADLLCEIISVLVTSSVDSAHREAIENVIVATVIGDRHTIRAAVRGALGHHISRADIARALWSAGMPENDRRRLLGWTCR